jgi:Ni/Fe-hydrogenase subunit HybB-like protein
VTEIHWGVIAAFVIIGFGVGIAVGGWVALSMIEDIVRKKVKG